MRRFLLHLAGASVWIFIFFKLFILDLDVIALQSFAPRYLWLLNLKFFWIGAIFLAFWLFAPTPLFRKTSAFIVFYPLVLLFWVIPRTFFKNWTSAFVLVFALLSALVAVKFRLTLWFIATLSCVLIPLTSNRYLLIASMVALFAYLLAHLGRHLRVAFRPITVFDRGSRWVAGQWNGVKDTLFRNNIAALATLPPDSENFRKKRFESLNNLLVWNSLFLFVSSKLKRLSESRIMIGYCLASLLYTSAITIVAYAFEYYALAKHSPSNFDGYTGQGFWFFMYFSFNTILRAGSGSFSAASPISRFLTVLEVATGVYIGGILIWLIITVFRERYTDEVKRLVEGLNREGDALETVIVDELHMSRQEAEAEVRQINPQSADFITRLAGRQNDS
jgi:hypothetical protein